MNAISYPPSRMRSVTIEKFFGTLLCWLSTAPDVCEYRPLRIVARAGRHRELIQKAFLKSAPSRAMRSMCGVLSNGFPAIEDSSQRAPSPRKNTMLGLASGVLDAGVLRNSADPMTAAPA